MTNQTPPVSELEAFRHEKDEFFKHSSQSPLDRKQKREFQGLKYFPENPALRLEVTVERFPPGDQIEMQTSTGDVQHYERYGRFHFTVEGQDAELTIYHSDTGFFLPFVDSLANKETYGAGRYLEPEPLDDAPSDAPVGAPTGERFYVDFNLAYNPYCAYNEMWSCPLTPFENRVKAPIRAGERIYHQPS